MASNAASFYRYNNQGRRGVGELMYYSGCVDKGRGMIEEAMHHLPDDWRVYQAMARLLEDRTEPATTGKLPGRGGRRRGGPAPLPSEISSMPMRSRTFRIARRKPAVGSAPFTTRARPITCRRCKRCLEIFRAAELAATTEQPQALHRRLRAIYDQKFPLTQTPLLVRTIRLLEGRLGLPAEQRLAPDARSTAGQRSLRL